MRKPSLCLTVLLRPLRALFRATGGAAAFEFGLLAPMLVAIFVPMIDLGLGFYQQMQVQDAAQAGAQYAMAHGFNSGAISNAVTAATPLASITALPAPSKSCGCPSGTSIETANCGANCDNGQAASTYVTVSAQATYTPIIPYPGIGSTITLSAQSSARIQ